MMSQLVAGLGDLRLPATVPQYRRGDREACAAVARCDGCEGDACAFGFVTRKWLHQNRAGYAATRPTAPGPVRPRAHASGTTAAVKPVCSGLKVTRGPRGRRSTLPCIVLEQGPQTITQKEI